MFRSTLVAFAGALTMLLAACSTPTSPATADDPTDGSPVGLAPAVTATSASCVVRSVPVEFTVTVSWSKLPVQRVVLWHSLGDRFYTVSLDHQSQKGTATVQLGYEPVLAVYYDRAGAEVARRNCNY